MAGLCEDGNEPPGSLKASEASCKADLNNFKGKIVPGPGIDPGTSDCGYKGKSWDGVGWSSRVAQLGERWYVQSEVPGSNNFSLDKSALQEAT
ncbi:hypothetical protein ANN_04669 [Periplaneta americana]|uniref:Uncharacterized protein n=1 Tax=Periplaneta americana TaxID=6978 RepID=A0ABQ8T946_PERAM|nr:hypothetical protein ANN_04669 [Periplaneta americana]